MDKGQKIGERLGKRVVDAALLIAMILGNDDPKYYANQIEEEFATRLRMRHPDTVSDYEAHLILCEVLAASYTTAVNTAHQYPIAQYVNLSKRPN